MVNRNRIALLVATGAAAAALGFAGAPAALADGPDTPRTTVVEIEALEWPEFREGESAWQIASAQYLLKAYGYYDGEATGDFDGATADAVRAYQEAKDLPDSGALDAETWNDLRNDFGEVGPGATGDRVRAVQHALVHGYGYDLDVDGNYGSGTAAAVTEFQTVQEIDADGYTGPITFRALITGGV
ncbi:peptidoglycan-binding domain-containing protein [Nocardiopsis composta]|uniref:Peptidoglycan hydrolase-like protein with peptidoglycan-binding domain n=1 Tax=Nocardiopsis composta TaxID=157465 RepID=A0A7W8QIA2_9ACTN|nr:peptidoglycan-binding protein [Nocardiopsis composta]MBB5430041.1 peptidoglycan hydrolase-like protein with peptidoglycan-binding domain [Nocardiopsis composta]